MQTIFLLYIQKVVPKHSLKEWYGCYETLMPTPDPPQPPPIVPRSSYEVAKDEEFSLVTVGKEMKERFSYSRDMLNYN